MLAALVIGITFIAGVGGWYNGTFDRGSQSGQRVGSDPSPTPSPSPSRHSA